MFTDLATLRPDVKDRLTPDLPETWKYEEYLETAVKSLTPVLCIEFVRLDTVVAGAPLGRGQVGAVLNLRITDPKTDTEKAEDAVDTHVGKVIRALDKHEDLVWDNATKARLQDGPMTWSFLVTAIVSTAEPTPTEGD